MDNYAEVIRKGVEIAKRAGKKVALDIGPTGKLLKPMGDFSVNTFRQTCIRLNNNRQTCPFSDFLNKCNHLLWPETAVKAYSIYKIAKRAGKKVALDIGPTGKLLKPMGDLDFEKAIEVFAQVVNAGKDGSDFVGII